MKIRGLKGKWAEAEPEDMAAEGLSEGTRIYGVTTIAALRGKIRTLSMNLNKEVRKRIDMVAGDFSEQASSQARTPELH